MKKEKYDVVIIGGGASGLMCANILKRKKVALIESNTKLGTKMRVSGGGKCNITNKFLDTNHYLGDKDFIKSVFKQFNNNSMLKFLKDRHIVLHQKDIVAKGQYFCQKSSYPIEMLQKGLNAKVFLSTTLISVSKNVEFLLKCNNKEFYAKNVVIATGSPAYPQLKSSDIGLTIAKNFRIEINKFEPALVGLSVQSKQFWFKELSGVSIDVKISYGQKIIEGPMLFSHKGCTGPAIMNASLFWEKGPVSIDFIPNYSLLELLKSNSNKQISSILPLPKRFTKLFLISIGLEDKQLKTLSDIDIQKLFLIKNYEFAPAGNFGLRRSEVCKGGISTNALDKNNMMSKDTKGLFFIGEVVDVTGLLGGYNLQWSFSSAFVCADYLNSTL